MGQLMCMDATGHDNVIKWGESEAEQAIARETFEKYKAKGFAMFAMDEDDNQGMRITSFNPSLHGIIAVPRMAGG